MKRITCDHCDRSITPNALGRHRKFCHTVPHPLKMAQEFLDQPNATMEEICEQFGVPMNNSVRRHIFAGFEMHPRIKDPLKFRDERHVRMATQRPGMQKKGKKKSLYIDMSKVGKGVRCRCGVITTRKDAEGKAECPFCAAPQTWRELYSIPYDDSP